MEEVKVPVKKIKKVAFEKVPVEKVVKVKVERTPEQIEAAKEKMKKD